MNLHGTPKTPWTMLDATVAVGATELNVVDAVTNWVVGDEIVIATTDFYGDHSEAVTITAITGQTITFEPALRYEHISVEETHGGKDLHMKAEVGMLSRNIVI